MVALALVALPLVLVDFLVAYIWLTGLELGVSPFLIPFLYPCLYRYAFPLPTREPALEKHRAPYERKPRTTVWRMPGRCTGGSFCFFVFSCLSIFLWSFTEKGRRESSIKQIEFHRKKKRKNLIKRAINFEKTKFRRKRRKRNISNFPKTIKFKKKKMEKKQLTTKEMAKMAKMAKRAKMAKNSKKWKKTGPPTLFRFSVDFFLPRCKHWRGATSLWKSTIFPSCQIRGGRSKTVKGPYFPTSIATSTATSTATLTATLTVPLYPHYELAWVHCLVLAFSYISIWASSMANFQPFLWKSGGISCRRVRVHPLRDNPGELPTCNLHYLGLLFHYLYWTILYVQIKPETNQTKLFVSAA